MMVIVGGKSKLGRFDIDSRLRLDVLAKYSAGETTEAIAAEIGITPYVAEVITRDAIRQGDVLEL